MHGQTSIIASAIIPARQERVWEIACDTSRYPEWVENTLRVLRTDGPARPGATMEELTRIAGPWKSVTRWRVTEFDPPRRQVQQGEGVSTAKDMAVIIELSPAGQDTNFTLTLRYTPRFGPLGALIDRVISRTLAYAIVTGLLAGIYAGLVLLATQVPQHGGGGGLHAGGRRAV